MADRFWRGGTAAWDGTAGSKWAATVGGATGSAVPTSADDVFFDATSGAVTCTISTGNTGAKSITCTGFTGTLAGTAAISVSGSVTLVAGMTYTYTGTLSLIGIGTITSAGKTLGPVTVSNSGITVTLGDALTLGTTNTFTLTQGTIVLNGFTLSAGIFSSSGSLTREITFGSANIALTSTTAGTTVLSMATASNFTATGTGGFTRNQAATATITFGTSGGTTNNVANIAINSGSSALTISTGSEIRNLDLTGSTCAVSGTALINGVLTVASGGAYTSFNPTLRSTQTFSSFGKTFVGFTFGTTLSRTLTLGDALTVSGTFSLTGGLGATALDLNGFTLSAGAFSSTGTFFRSIAFGSANIALTSTTASATVLDMATATNFTFTGTGGFTRNQAATATVVFGTTGGSSTNAPNLTVNAGASTLAFTANSYFKNLNFTGSSCSVSGSTFVYGNITLSATGTYSSMYFRISATTTFDSIGKTIGSVGVRIAGTTVTLASALTVDSGGFLSLEDGTLDLNSFTATCGYFTSTTTGTRSIAFGSGNIVTTSTGPGSIFLFMATATGFTYTGTGGFVRAIGSGEAQFGATGGSVTNAPNLTITGGSGAIAIQTNSWFNNLNFTGNSSAITCTNLNIAGNLTLASGGTYTGIGTIIYRDTGTLTNNSKTISALTVNGSGITVTCADALTTTGALTLTDGALKLKDGATSDFGSIVTTGTTLKYLESSTAGSQATITDPTGTNTVTYLSIKDSNATGGAGFDARDPTNVNAGNNSGWLFAGGGGNFFLIF